MLPEKNAETSGLVSRVVRSKQSGIDHPPLNSLPRTSVSNTTIPPNSHLAVS